MPFVLNKSTIFGQKVLEKTFVKIISTEEEEDREDGFKVFFPVVTSEGHYLYS